ncbi:MAG: aminotransferase class I/II-fold pyridoxal phosphate-dependent enzyme [Chitinophagaceae bacterium]|nr:aminotransferase class I/II-fold pyridoxal phosphate-dependent enzyme [Chitinophagaceae bacterium]
MHIQSKLPKVGTTIFTVMSGLAAQHNAINLGQGFPDFSMDEALMDEVTRVMKEGFNQYVPMQGYMPLREAIAEKADFLYNAKIDPANEITITPGGTYAIYTALTTILNPGDEVIVFEPAYDSYIPNIEVNGAVAVRIPLDFPSYAVNWNEVRRKINSKTKAIIINSPHNPTGSILTEEDLKALASIVEGTNIFIISDEVYEHLVFDQKQHQSVLRYPELKKRSFVCFSFGKVYHCTGWKLGYCIADAPLMEEFRKIHQFNCFSCHTPSQVALSRYLTNSEAYLGLGPAMQKKRDYFIQLMKETPFELLHSSGSYFITAKYDKISNLPDHEFAVELTKKAGVTTIPVSAFYYNSDDNNVIRFCFAKKEETLERAVERLVSLKSL